MPTPTPSRTPDSDVVADTESDVVADTDAVADTTTGNTTSKMTPRKADDKKETPVPRGTGAAKKDKSTKKISKKWQRDYLLANPRSLLVAAGPMVIELVSFASRHSHSADPDVLTPRPRPSSPTPCSGPASPRPSSKRCRFPQCHLLNAGMAAAEPDFASVPADSFHMACARYSMELRSGLHQREWLDHVWEAHELRKAGCFDAAEARCSLRSRSKPSNPKSCRLSRRGRRKETKTSTATTTRRRKK